MSRLITIKATMEFLHDNDPELYHAELLNLIEEHMGKEFRELIADKFDELEEALRVADELESEVDRLENEVDILRAELESAIEAI